MRAKLNGLASYVDRTGATVRQKVPGMFKWEVTPGYWLLQVIWDFFMEPCPELQNEKSTAAKGQRDGHVRLQPATMLSPLSLAPPSASAHGFEEKFRRHTRWRERAPCDRVTAELDRASKTGAGRPCDP